MSNTIQITFKTPDAQALYEEHGTKLRIAGHCGCVPPEPPWLRDKFECVGASTNAEGEKFYDQLVEVRLDGELLTTCEWGEIDKFIKQKRKEWPMEKCWGGVENYDIDTQEALNALTHYLRNRKC